MTREAQIEHFLSHTNWAQANRAPMSQDASFRRYWRLQSDTGHALLMDAPPPEKPVSLFADIAKFLRDRGLYAPQIYAQDDANGLMLIEDFGDDTFTRILINEPASEFDLYDLAIDTLTDLHQITPDKSLLLGQYDGDTLIREASLFCEWFYPYASGAQASEQLQQGFALAWQQSLNQLLAHNEVLVLRDYHVDNLMRLRNNGHTLCGILDFQDALIGSPAYDLMSLLEDARRDISPQLQQRCLSRYFATMARVDANFPEQKILQPWLNVLAAQRHAKVLGIFVRLSKRDKKDHYLNHLPRVLALYKAAIEREPCLQPIARWMQAELPFDSFKV